MSGEHWVRSVSPLIIMALARSWCFFSQSERQAPLKMNIIMAERITLSGHVICTIRIEPLKSAHSSIPQCELDFLRKVGSAMQVLIPALRV